MSFNKDQYIHWQEKQLEPDLTMARSGGRPRNKGGVNLWEEFKRIQDMNDKWREEEEKAIGSVTGQGGDKSVG